MMKKMMIAAMMATTVVGALPAAAQDGGWRGREGRGQGRIADNPAMQRGGDDNRRWNNGTNNGGDSSRWRGGDRPAPAVAPAPATPAAQPPRPGIAVGEPNPNGNWRDRQQNWQQGRDARQDWRQDRRDDRRDWRQDNREVRQDWRQDRRDDRRDWREDRRDGRRDWRQDRRDDRRDWRGDRRSEWNRGWRDDRRYDWRDFRNRYGDRYRARPYYAPRGWDRGYSRFSIGISIGSPFYARNYWISDPYYYRLPPAYGTLRWVRYYDDAMLVDIRDGYVVDVIYDFFW